MLRSNHPIAEKLSQLLASVFDSGPTASLRYRIIFNGIKGKPTKELETERISAEALVQAVVANKRLVRAERELLANLLDATGSRRCRLEFRAAKKGRPVDETIEPGPVWKFITERTVNEFRLDAANLTDADFDQPLPPGAPVRRLRLRDLVSHEGVPYAEGKPSRATAYRNWKKARGTRGSGD